MSPMLPCWCWCCCCSWPGSQQNAAGSAASSSSDARTGSSRWVRNAWEQGRKCGNVRPDLGLNSQKAVSLNELLDCVNIIIGHMLCTKQFKPKGAQLLACVDAKAQAWKAGVDGCGGNCRSSQSTHTLQVPAPNTSSLLHSAPYPSLPLHSPYLFQRPAHAVAAVHRPSGGTPSAPPAAASPCD